MFSHTAPFGIGLHGKRAPLSRPQTARTPVAASTTTTWLERLAAWAERQPAHHHLGSCGRL